MLDLKLQFVEDGERCWIVVVEALLTTTVQRLFALDRVFITAFSALESTRPFLFLQVGVA